MNYRKLLYDGQEVEHYGGWTIATLRDRVDDDYSYVAKPGKHIDGGMQSTSSGEPEYGINFTTRELASSAAKVFIDSRGGFVTV